MLPAAGPVERAWDWRQVFSATAHLFDGHEPAEVLQLAAHVVPCLGPFTVEASYRAEAGLLRPSPPQSAGALRPGTAASSLGADRDVARDDDRWHHLLGLRAGHDVVGCLVVGAPAAPDPDALFALGVLAHEAATAVAHAQLAAREQQRSRQLRQLARLREVIKDRTSTIGELATEVARLQGQQHVQRTVAVAAAAGSADAALLTALHQLTGLASGLEDTFGNLRAWQGPERAGRYRRTGGRNREDLLRRAAASCGPLREANRVLQVIRPRQDVLGLLYLWDPDHRVGELDELALTQTAAALGVEMAHQRDLAETELRLRRHLAEDLVAGTDEASAVARADLLGHDLRQPHRVVTLSWDPRTAVHTVAEAVRHCVGTRQVPSLLTQRGQTVVLVTQASTDPDALYRGVAEELAPATGVLGVGSVCAGPAGLPQSFADALRAQEVRRHTHHAAGVVRFDELGVYRLLDSGGGPEEVRAFVRENLGPLLDYDELHGSTMVATLTQYLERGGGYDATARALLIHRSTLRYRLARIRELTGGDLHDVDTRLNLHLATRALQVLRGAEVAAVPALRSPAVPNQAAEVVE